MTFVVDESFIHVRLFATLWSATHQASQSFTISQSELKFMSIELVMFSNHLILCCPLLFCLQFFPASSSFPMSRLAIPFSSGSSQPRDQTWVSCIAGRLFIVRATRKVPEYMSDCPQKWKNRVQGSGKFLRHFPEILQNHISWGEKLTSLVPPGTSAEAAYWWSIPNDASSIFLLKISI